MPIIDSLGDEAYRWRPLVFLCISTLLLWDKSMNDMGGAGVTDWVLFLHDDRNRMGLLERFGGDWDRNQ